MEPTICRRAGWAEAAGWRGAEGGGLDLGHRTNRADRLSAPQRRRAASSRNQARPATEFGRVCLKSFAPRAHESSFRVHDADDREQDRPSSVHDAGDREQDCPSSVHDADDRGQDRPSSVHDADDREQDRPSSVHDADDREQDCPSSVHDADDREHGRRIPPLETSGFSRVASSCQRKFTYLAK